MFVQYVHELLESFGDVTVKVMFRGFGGYLRGAMVALIANKTLSLKASDITRQYFETQKLEPFRAQKNDTGICHVLLPSST